MTCWKSFRWALCGCVGFGLLGCQASAPSDPSTANAARNSAVKAPVRPAGACATDALYAGNSHAASKKVTKKDVEDWTAKGVRDDVIVDRIERSNSEFRLTAADENQLRDAHVSEDVIDLMKEMSRRPSSFATRP